MSGDHHGRTAGRATLLVRAVDDILGTHSRTGSGPANLATIRAAPKDVGYLHVPEGRRDHSTPAETLRLH